MAVTYTENLHLGMQLDKTDFFSMDVINENWQKIDAAVSGSGMGTAGNAALSSAGANEFDAGVAEFSEV
jgi:hypothetical protein